MGIREVVDATRQAVSQDPGKALVRLRVDASLGGGTETGVQMARHTITVDEPKSLGGTGAGANPIQLALASLASCQALTYRYWAEILGIRVDSVAVHAEGDVDIRGYFGLASGVPAGLSGVTCTITISGPEDKARYQELQAAVDEHCPLLDIFTTPVPVTRELEIA